MQRRVLLAFLLSFLVLYAYQALFVPTPPPNRGAPGGPSAVDAVPRPAPASEPFATGGAAPDTAPIAGLTPAAARAGPAEADAPEGPPVVAAEAVESIVVESDALRAVFTNRGAALVSWQLPRYLDESSGEPVDLVPRDLPPQEPSPFNVAFADPGLTARAAAGLYRASASTLRLAGRPETLAFEFEDAGGLRVHKEFRFEPASPSSSRFPSMPPWQDSPSCRSSAGGRLSAASSRAAAAWRTGSGRGACWTGASSRTARSRTRARSAPTPRT